MSQPLAGEIRIFAGNYAPRGWAFCDGQTISIADCPDLFNAIGITHGGDGKRTFALPDMRGRIAVHRGRAFPHGTAGGAELSDIAPDQVPVHNHTSVTGTSGSSGAAVSVVADSRPITSFGSDGVASAAGADNAHENMQPYLSVHFIIALSGDAEPVSIDAPFVGEIRIFAGRTVPSGWQRCDGQSLNVGDHAELFAVLGTTYGGDGAAAFALPDLRERAALHAGQGDGLTLRKLGEQGGQSSVALSESQLPFHSHQLVNAQSSATLLVSASNGSPAWGNALAYENAASGASNGAGHNNMQPYLALNYLIATRGNMPA